MAKQTAERARTEEVRRRGDGRAAFLAHLDRIKAHVASGRTMIQFYQENAEALGIGYPQFTRYVERFITEKEKPKAAQPAAPVDTPKERQNHEQARSSGGPIRVSSEPRRTFQYESDASRLDDLV